MTDQQQNGVRRPEQVSALLRAAKTMDELIASHDEEKRRADHYEMAYTKAEAENGHLREMLDRMIADRDGAFQSATILRASLMSIGNAVTDAVKSITEQQAFGPSLAHDDPIDDGKPMPTFLRAGPRDLDEAVPQRGSPINMRKFAAAIGVG